MKRYLLSLFVIGIVTGCMRYLFGATHCEKHVKWIASLVTVLVFLTPLISLFGNIPDSITLPRPDVTSVNSEKNEDIILEIARDNLCRTIAKILKDEGIVAKDIDVILTYHHEKTVFVVEVIHLSLNKKDEVRGRAILSEQFDCEIEIYGEDSL